MNWNTNSIEEQSKWIKNNKQNVTENLQNLTREPQLEIGKASHVAGNQYKHTHIFAFANNSNYTGICKNKYQKTIGDIFTEPLEEKAMFQ